MSPTTPTDHSRDIVVVGGGHAAAQLCSRLADLGLGSRIQLVCEEPRLPYHRPPLSKTYLYGVEAEPEYHLSADWYEAQGVRYHLGDPVVALDRERRGVLLRSGQRLDAEWIVLATGAQLRMPSEIASEDLPNVAALHTHADALALRQKLQSTASVTILGGGYLGLEIAAAAAKLGKKTLVLEAAPRLLARSGSREVGDFLAAYHRSSGVEVHEGLGLTRIEVREGRAQAVVADYARFPVDLLVVAIGSVPKVTLAKNAGLECDDGIVVNDAMQTEDPHILAIGDCARITVAGAAQIRYQSVHGASEQARVAASTITSGAHTPVVTPWFWSEQGGVKLQIVGMLPTGGALEHATFVRTGKSANSFSVGHYVEGKLVCVESVNAPLDHIMSRRMLDAGLTPPGESFADPTTDLKSVFGSLKAGSMTT